jgi:hypothetical protein
LLVLSVYKRVKTCYNINVSCGGQQPTEILYFTKEETQMTTYETLGYETSEALRDAINSDLSALAYPYTVKHKVYGQGQLTFVKAPLIGGSLYATIDFAAGTKTLSLDVVLAGQMLEMPLTLADTLIELQTVFKADFIEREQAKRAADRLAREQAREAEIKAKEEKEAEEKYQKQKAKALKDFEAFTGTLTPKSAADEFYYSLGWLAKHVGAMTAILPDYLGNAFEQHFGADTPKTLVDSRAKTIGGYAKQWSWEFKCTIKKLKETVVPAYLHGITTDFSKGIHNTSFLWDLVDNYGFQFGKKQDVEKIRACVPSDKLSFFEAGLA